MRRIVISDPRHIHPFNERARDLRIQNKPLWLLQRDLLSPYVDGEMEYPDWALAQRFELDPLETIVHKDNLYFNAELIEEFITRARRQKQPVRLAFRKDDPAIREHVKPLTTSLFEQGELYLADLWYLPNGISESVIAQPLVVDMEARERGYYHIPPYMSSDFGDLVYMLPRKAFVSIESWVHIFIADILFGVFTYGANIEDEINAKWTKRLSIMLRSIWEQKPFIASSELVVIGQNATIHPTAKITGPAIIGNNVNIDAGVVIDACIIGDNVTVSQGCQLLLSVVGDGCFLPFRAALFMTTMMENSMVAQNSCLQLCVVGRDSFIGAGSTFTDFSVLSAPIRAINGNGVLENSNLQVLGGCVGHHCRLGSGVIMQPARTVESDVVILPNDERHFIDRHVAYEDSDALQYAKKYPYPRLYPRRIEEESAEGIFT